MGKSTSESKSVVITGAASGIGRATALLFAESGYRVALIDLPGSDLAGTMALLPTLAKPHEKYFADVSSESEVAQTFQKIESDFTTLDAAVNNAGIEGGVKRFLDYTGSDVDRIFAVNVRGVFLCLQQEVRIMEKQKRGAIVNLSSILGVVGSAGSSLYSASKHAVLGLTKSLAMEVARKGIRINAVCPGGVETPMIDRARTANAALVDLAQKMHPIGRFADPREIAQAILWLCSEESSFAVGHGLVMDGGFTAG